MTTAFILTMLFWQLIDAGMMFAQDGKVAKMTGCIHMTLALWAVATLLVHLGAL